MTVSKLSVSNENPDFKKYYFDEVTTEAFLRQLLHDQFVLITAEKGAGVSTFLNYIAYNIQHKVRSDAMGNEPDKWLTIKVRPGLDPQKSLLRELSKCDFTDAKKSVSFESESEALLNSSNSLGLVNLFKVYPVRKNEKLLVIIDPLDDLFLFEDNYQSESINRFVNLLYTFPQHSSLPVYFVISFANKYSDRSNYYIKLLDLLYKYKFKFTGPELKDLPEMVRLFFQDLPASVRVDFHSFSDQLKSDLENFRAENAWKYLLQFTMKLFKEECLKLLEERKEELRSKEYIEIDWRVFYERSGGVNSVVDRQADRIMATLSDEEKDLCFLMFRTQVNKLGNFEPIRFQEMLEIMSAMKRRNSNELKHVENLVKTFTIKLELLELIFPIDIEDRGTVLTKEFKISPGTVIMLRNSFFKTQWQFFNACIEEKVKLVLDYEWYCRMAQKQTENEYPSSLQPYALAERTAPETLDNPEFTFINIIRDLSPSWVIRNIGKSKSDLEDLERTKLFIQNGIAFWKKKAEEEEKERKRQAKRRERMMISIFVFIILFGFSYVTINGLRQKTQDNYDILMQKNLFVRISIDSLFTNYIKKSEFNVNVNVNKILDSKTDSFLLIKRTLVYEPKKLQVEDKYFIRFLMIYNSVKENQKKTITDLQRKGAKALSLAIDEYCPGKDKDQVFAELKNGIKNKMRFEFGQDEYDKFCENFPDEAGH